MACCNKHPTLPIQPHGLEAVPQVRLVHSSDDGAPRRAHGAETQGLTRYLDVFPAQRPSDGKQPVDFPRVDVRFIRELRKSSVRRAETSEPDVAVRARENFGREPCRVREDRMARAGGLARRRRVVYQ